MWLSQRIAFGTKIDPTFKASITISRDLSAQLPESSEISSLRQNPWCLGTLNFSVAGAIFVSATSRGLSELRRWQISTERGSLLASEALVTCQALATNGNPINFAEALYSTVPLDLPSVGGLTWRYI
jgi:hypothetical protein